MTGRSVSETKGKWGKGDILFGFNISGFYHWQ
jgi:hypothetical protein